MGNINVQVKHGGTNITTHVVAYQREKRICTGIGMLSVTVDVAYGGTFDPWDEIRLYEKGKKVGTYFVNEVSDIQPDSTYVVVAQDASKYLVDYFISEPTTIDTPQYNKTWIINYLEEAGITSYEFNTSSPGVLISNNTVLGMNSAYDQITYLVQIAGWYFFFDRNNKCIIGKLDTDLANPTGTFNNGNIVEIHRLEHDKMFRNRVVVWGTSSGVFSDAVGVEVYKITPWNYDENDLRTIVISNHNIPSSGIATAIAQEALDYFDEISVEKHIHAKGAFPNMDIGDAARVSSRVWKGKGLVTTFGSELSSNGWFTNVVLDEKCPRLFAYFDFGDYVYIGTTESGVYRKHIKFENKWYNYNGGYLPSGEILGISDLFVRGDVGTAVTFSGGAAYCDTNTFPADWQGIVLSSIQAKDANDTPILLSNPDVKARACTVDRTSLEPRYVLDTWSGRNYKNYVDMYYNRFSSPYFLFSGYIYNGVTPLTDNFTLSGYTPASGFSEAWVLSVSPSSIDDNGLGLYPINFSGVVAASGGLSIEAFDIENDGAFDYVSVKADRDPIFYLNTVYSGQEYITGFNVSTRLPVTHIHSSGIQTNTESADNIVCRNVGNMMSSIQPGVGGNVVLLNNHTIDSTIPTSSGQYDFGTGFYYPEYSSEKYVSLMAVPSGTFMDDIVISTTNHTLLDKIDAHEVARYDLTGLGRLYMNKYTFDDTGWTFVSTQNLQMPNYGGLFPNIEGPMENHIYTISGTDYYFLTYRQTSQTPIRYRWIVMDVHFDTSAVNATELTGDTAYQPTPDFMDGRRAYISLGGGGQNLIGAGQAGAEDEPYWLYIVDILTKKMEKFIIFDGMPPSLTQRGTSWYRMKTFPFKDTFQAIGFAYVHNVDADPDQIEVYRISGVSGKAGIDLEPIYIETDVDFFDAQLQAEHGYRTFTKEWSLAYYQAFESHETFGWLGNPKNSILNFGPHGIYNLQTPIVEQLGDTEYSPAPWLAGDAGATITPIADEIFDNIAIITTSGTGTYFAFPPFLKTEQAYLGAGHVTASQPYTRPESTRVRRFMVLRRDGNNFDIVTGGASFPYRLDASHTSPLVTDGLYRFGFETYYVSQSDVTKIDQLHPLTGIFASGVVTSSGVGFDIVNDFRYTTFESASISGFGQQLLYTSSGGIWTTPVADYSTFTLYSGYVNSLASGVIIGSASMLETSNFAYPEQYVFLSTITNSGNYNFYQKLPSGLGIFEDCSLFSGYPNSEITIIRLEDIV